MKLSKYLVYVQRIRIITSSKFLVRGWGEWDEDGLRREGQTSVFVSKTNILFYLLVFIC